MITKTLSFISLILAVLACNKLDYSSSEHISQNCSLTVTFNEPATKVSGQSANEKNIKDVQVFVFNSRTQKLDAAVRESVMNVSEGSYSLSSRLDCTRGTKEIWAIVNAPINYVDGSEGDRITELSQLRSLTSRLTDNKEDGLVMTGSCSVELTKADESVSLSVERICAAIVIESISNEILIPAYQKAGKVKITGAYLMNVPNLQKFDKSLAASSLKSGDWISANAKSTDATQLLLTSDSYSSRVIEYGQKIQNLSTFYSYPNDCSDEPGSSWSPSRTVLVVEAEIDGQACIYPIRLGELRSNYKYMVSLTIRHMGCDPSEPWKKIEFTDMSASIRILDWNTGGPAIDETI